MRNKKAKVGKPILFVLRALQREESQLAFGLVEAVVGCDTGKAGLLITPAWCWGERGMYIPLWSM
jgi:hypothetical protein